MYAFLTIAQAAATEHSASTAETIKRLQAATDAPVLIALEGDPTSALWLRLEGWITVPIELIHLSPGGDIAAQMEAARSQSELPCALHLRQVDGGWEGALQGECGEYTLPVAMAFTSAATSATSLWGLSAQQRHGFRVGYAYTQDDRTFTSPHLMVMGYEIGQKIAGGEGLDVLMVGNISVSGLNQSKLFPVLNLLLGVELSNAFQIGVGPSISWTQPADEALHMIVTAGWMVSNGALDVPLHLSWIPDVNNRDRIIATTGVTF